MAHDRPDLTEILATVHEFLADLVPRIEGLDRYHALCAIHLLEIASRELAAEWQHRETADDRRLRALVGAPPGLPMREVCVRLCADIRGGRFDADLEALFAPLLAHVAAKTRIVKPEVLAVEHEQEDGADE